MLAPVQGVVLPRTSTVGFQSPWLRTMLATRSGDQNQLMLAVPVATRRDLLRYSPSAD